MLKKIFLKKISSVLGLFIVCGFSLTLGAILLRVAFSAFTQPTSLPDAADKDLGALAAKVNDLSTIIGTPNDPDTEDTVFGKIAGAGGGGVSGGGNNLLYMTIDEYNTMAPIYQDSLKLTTQTYQGNFGGINGANAACDAEFPGYVLCQSINQSTLLYSNSPNGPFLPWQNFLNNLGIKNMLLVDDDKVGYGVTTILVSNQLWYAPSTINNCNNWTSNSSSISGPYTIVAGNFLSVGKYSNDVYYIKRTMNMGVYPSPYPTCDNSFPFLCCKVIP